MEPFSATNLPKVGDIVVVNAKLAKDKNLPTGVAQVKSNKPSGWLLEWPNGTSAVVPVTGLVPVDIEGVEKAKAEAPAPPAPKPAPVVKTEKPEPVCGFCRCGCGERVATPKARFVSGHDARLDSLCRKVVTGRATEDEAERVAAAETAGWLIVRECGHVALYDHVPCPCSAEPKAKKAAHVKGEPRQTVKDLQAQLADLQALVLKLTAESSHPDIVDPEELSDLLDAIPEDPQEA